ncbi:MAG: hypothetical protein ACLQPH_00040 [Acidimicrobiales bacterium]
MDNDDSPLADTAVHFLTSTHVGEGIKIYVGHCPGDRSRASGVVCLVDANGFFGVVIDLIRGMQLARHLPTLLVIGVAYRAAGISDTLAPRTRDPTATVLHAFGELVQEQSEIGGASALLEFLRQELMPWVSASRRRCSSGSVPTRPTAAEFGSRNASRPNNRRSPRSCQSTSWPT